MIGLKDGEVVFDELAEPQNRQQRRAAASKNTSVVDASALEKAYSGPFKQQQIITRKNFTTRKV